MTNYESQYNSMSGYQMNGNNFRKATIEKGFNAEIVDKEEFNLALLNKTRNKLNLSIRNH